MSRRTVTVTGAGTASGAPDLAVVHLRADALRAGAADAVGAAQECVDRVRTALRDTGLGSDGGAVRAESTALSLHAEESWHHDPGSGQNVRQRRGFRAGHGLRVEVREVARLGEVLTALLAAGGDDLALDRVDHDVTDPSALRDRARAAAWDDARHRAVQHAGAAGSGLGEVVEVVEQVVGGPVPVATRGASALAAEVSVEPGGVDVAVQVRVTWELG